MRRPLVLAFVAALSASLLSAPEAAAFCRSTTCSDNCARDLDDCKIEGAKLEWKTQCVSFSVQQDGSEHIDLEVIRDVVTKSFVEWSDRECPEGGIATMAFTAEADAACHAAEYNEDGPNANIVLFQDYRWSYTSEDNTLAKTTVTYDTETGEILDADIEMNHAYNELTTSDDDVAYDLQSILTHEIGHFVGLDHTLDFIATMNAGYQEGTTELRTLEDDDIAGLCAAYPPGRDVKCNPTPKGGFSGECAVAAAEDDGGCSLAPAPYAGRDAAPQRTPPWAWVLSLGAAVAMLRRRSRGGMACDTFNA